MLKQNREAVHARQRVRMLGAECSFLARECSATQWFCSRVVALIAEQNREVVHARQRVRMLRAECSFPGREDPAIQWFCSRAVALIAEQIRESADALKRVRVVGAESHLRLVQNSSTDRDHKAVAVACVLQELDKNPCETRLASLGKKRLFVGLAYVITEPYPISKQLVLIAGVQQQENACVLETFTEVFSRL